MILRANDRPPKAKKEKMIKLYCVRPFKFELVESSQPPKTSKFARVFSNK